MEYFRYRKTNCFFVRSTKSDRLLALDAGWPCTLFEYKRGVKTIGYDYERIGWAIVTHFHMDHAGLIGDFLQSGIQCYTFENQNDFIDDMERIIGKKNDDYKRIDRKKLQTLGVADSRALFASMGIGGEVVRTPGHSEDSISFVTDEKEAVIGDLYPMDQIMADDEKSNASWETLIGLGIRTIYPSHADVFTI